MPIRFKFGNDLNIFGKAKDDGRFISAPPFGGEVPPYGTELSREVQAEYTDGNSQFFDGVTYYADNCDLVTYADGFGGTYTEYDLATINHKTGVFYSASYDVYVTISEYNSGQSVSSVCGTENSDYSWEGDGINYSATSNVSYYEYGTLIESDNFYSGYTAGGTISLNGVDYYTQEFINDYFSDGYGGYYLEINDIRYKAADSIIEPNLPVYQTMPPARPELGGVEGEYPNGKVHTAYWDGVGGYYFGAITGSYYPNNTAYFYESFDLTVYITELDSEYPDGSGTSSYTWNGYGASGATTTVINWFGYGTLIVSSSGYDFFSDGEGGYYSMPV